jgi:hypothetical protein
MRYQLAALTLAVSLTHSAVARAQASYRNLDAGFPVRVEDATVTERYALDLDFLNFRYDELSDLRTRLQYEPRCRSPRAGYALRPALRTPTIASSRPDATTIAAPVGRSIR